MNSKKARFSKDNLKNGLTLKLLLKITALIILVGVLLMLLLNGEEIEKKQITIERYSEEQIKEKVQQMLDEYTAQKDNDEITLEDFLIKKKNDGQIEEYTKNEDGTYIVTLEGYDVTINKNLEITQVQKNANSVIMTYTINRKSAAKDEKIAVFVTFKDQSGIKEILLPEEEILTVNNRTKVGIDYYIKLNKEYKFIVTKTDGTQAEKTLIVKLTKDLLTISDTIIGLENPPKTDVGNQIYELGKTTLYVDFKTSILVGNVTVEPAIPYAITENGEYTFKVTGKYEEESVIKEVKIYINNFIEKPQIEVSVNKGYSITLQVKNKYADEDNMKYTYYMNSSLLAGKIKDKSYTINELDCGTEYKFKVAVTYKNITIQSDEIVVRTKGCPIIEINGEFERTVLKAPRLTLKGMMNCSTTNLIENEVLKVTIKNYELEIPEVYYSLDDGTTWIPYSQAFSITYTGENIIRAKNIYSDGTELYSRVILYKNYMSDSNINCEKNYSTYVYTIRNTAYDGNFNSYNNCDTQNWEKWYFEIDPECWSKYLTIYFANTSDYGCIAMYGVGGYIANITGESSTKLSAKSIQINPNTTSVRLYDGTGIQTEFYVYEIWCSEENLTGTVY